MVILPQKISFSMESFSEFIEKHENDDTARLLLSGKIPDNIDAGLAADTIEVRRKLKKKVPSWYAHPELAFPLKLGAEQCSSEITARYKAAFVHMIFRTLRDLVIDQNSSRNHRDDGNDGYDRLRHPSSSFFLENRDFRMPFRLSFLP